MGGGARAFVGGAVGAYAGAAMVVDPRRTGRKVVASVLFVASLFWVYVPWFSQANMADPNVGVAAVFAGVGSLAAAVSVSKFATRRPFAVFRYGDYLAAGFAGLVAKVFWGALFAGWVGAIVSTSVQANAADIGWSATLMVVGIVGVGVSAVRAEDRVMATAVYVRGRVAQLFGVDPDMVECGNTGSLRKPEYSCFFPVVVEAGQLAGVEQSIRQVLPGFEIVTLTVEGVAVA
jgi:hypothetical protein